MADDLKISLAKVLQNNGKKRYFFAYGTGKRTDGNGDGHLIVGAKKPKKNEIQCACACGSFIEGYCWSSADGAILYFASKGKLAAPIVAKMALTAKKVVGKQYDFQVPSSDEESRASSLSAGDEAASNETAPIDTAPNDVAERPTPPPSQNLGTTEPTPTPPPPPPPLDSENAKFTARLKGLVGRVAKSGAKAQALAKMKQAINEAKTFSQKPDFLQANLVLDRLENLLAEGSGSTTTSSAPLAETEQFRARLKVVAAEVVKAVSAKHPAANELKLVTSEAQVFARKQEFVQANALLDRIEALLREPGAPDAPKDGATGQAATVLKERLKQLAPLFKEALKADPAAKGLLDQDLAEANAAAKQGNLQSTLDSLDALEADIKNTLQSTKDPGGLEAEHTKAWKALESSYHQAIERAEQAKSGRDVELRSLYQEMTTFQKDGKFAEARDKFEALSAQIHGLLRATEVRKEVEEAAGVGNVKFKGLRHRWARARDIALAELERLTDTVLGHPEVIDDPRYETIASRVGEISQSMPRFDGSLEEALAALDEAVPADQPKAIQTATTALEKYEGQINAAPLLKKLEGTMFGSASIHTEMITALSGIRTILASK